MISCYSELHENTDIVAVVSASNNAYCVDCAVQILFNGDIEAFEAVDDGKDTSFIDKHGDPFTLIHERSNQYSLSDREYYPNGLDCNQCHAELILPFRRII